MRAGAFADPATRRAFAASAAVAVAMSVLGLVLVVTGVGRVRQAEDRQGELQAGGRTVEGLVLDVDGLVGSVRRASFSYPVDGERLRGTMVVVNPYQRGEPVTVHVDPDDPAVAAISGELPLSAAGWLVSLVSVLAGLVLVPLGVRRVVRAVRTYRVLSAHPWTPWVLVAAYPRRRRIAVTNDADPEEHLVRVDRWAAKRLGALARRSPVYLAGDGRWFALSPVDGRRSVSLGRMDEPYRRLGHLHPGARPDRFAS